MSERSLIVKIFLIGLYHQITDTIKIWKHKRK